MTLTLGRAIAIAAKAHENQLDRNGIDPYILHPLSVMQMMDTEDEKIVAVLHDVPEDTSVTFADLEDAGATKLQLETLDALTHREHEPYREYVLRALNSNLISRKVKIADYLHNTNDKRLSHLDEPTRQRLLNKYSKVSMLIFIASRSLDKDFRLITDDQSRRLELS